MVARLKTPKIPLPVKLAYSVFVAVLVPYYWVTYSPWNFLFFCDVALLLTLVALWREDALLVSVAAVGITVPQFVWVVDFLAVGRVVGIASYMFDDKIPLFVRGLSSFHGWLPFVLLWAVIRLGYDRKALAVQIALTWVLLLLCYSLGPVPPAPASDPNLAVNINYVHGPGFEAAQTWMPPRLWLALLMAGLPLVCYVPTHLILRRLIAEPAASLSAPIAESLPATGMGA